MCEWIKKSEQRGLARIALIQNAYNLVNRAYEIGLSEETRREALPLLAYSPLGSGYLSGKYLNGAKPLRAHLTQFPGFGPRYDAKVNMEEAVGAYAEFARSASLTPASMALAFVRSHWFVASTIVGATTMDQLEEDIDCVGVALDAEILAAIDQIHHGYPNRAA